MANRVTHYLWYCEGGLIRTEAGTVLGCAPSLDEAAEQFPDATFRLG